MLVFLVIHRAAWATRAVHSFVAKHPEILPFMESARGLLDLVRHIHRLVLPRREMLEYLIGFIQLYNYNTALHTDYVKQELFKST